MSNNLNLNGVSKDLEGLKSITDNPDFKAMYQKMINQFYNMIFWEILLKNI